MCSCYLYHSALDGGFGGVGLESRSHDSACRDWFDPAMADHRLRAGNSRTPAPAQPAPNPQMMSLTTGS